MPTIVQYNDAAERVRGDAYTTVQLEDFQTDGNVHLSAYLQYVLRPVDWGSARKGVEVMHTKPYSGTVRPLT
jgi:hypothetical protein